MGSSGERSGRRVCDATRELDAVTSGGWYCLSVIVSTSVFPDAAWRRVFLTGVRLRWRSTDGASSCAAGSLCIRPPERRVRGRMRDVT